METTCAECGAAFTPSAHHPHTRYCSKKCRSRINAARIKARRQREYATRERMPCAHCGGDLSHRMLSAVYCSERCRRDAAKPERPEPVELTGPLLRLRDVPEKDRLAAFRSLVDSGQLSESEIPVVLAAVLEPGDLSALAA